MTVSKALTKIDNGLAHVEETKALVEHWLKLHFSWAWRTHAYEETFTFSFSVTGKLRERARRLAIAKIKRDLWAMGARGPFVSGDGIDLQRACPEWLAGLPETGTIRTPKFDNAEIVAQKASLRHAAEAKRRGPAGLGALADKYNRAFR